MSNTQQPGNLGNKIIEKNKNGNNTNNTNGNNTNGNNANGNNANGNNANGNNANGNNANGNNANGNNANGNNANGNKTNNLESILKNNNAETKNVALSGKDADAMIAQQNKINANKTNANKTNANKPNTKKNNKVNTNKLNNKPQNQSLTMKAPETNQEPNQELNIPNADNQENNNTAENNNVENTNLGQNVVKANSKDKNVMVNLNKLTMNLLNHQIVLKLFHFQTELYGAHKASDGYLEKFAQTMDKFLEIAQGIYGKITLKKYTLTGSSHSDENIIKHIDGMITLLREKIDDVLGEYTDLINIRDELVGDAEQLKYLLSFK